jgi:hypothetical protein
MVVIAIIFIGIVTVFSVVSSVILPGNIDIMLLGDGIALAGAYSLYKIWHKRPIRLACRNCTKVILTNTPWYCVVCKKPNLNVTEFPFVYQCEHCGAEPKAYRCRNPLCKQIIYLSEDEDSTNYVYCLNSPDDISQEEARARQVKTHQELREDKEHDITIAEGDLELVDLKRRHKFIKSQMTVKRKKPPLEEKKKNLKNFFDGHVAAEQAVREQKAANAVEFKNDDKERKRRDRIADAWLEREKAGENENKE